MKHPLPSAALSQRLGLADDKLIVVDDRVSVTTERLRQALVYVRVTKTCWLFEGYRPSGKHGRIEYREQQIYIHRAIYAALHGPIPPEMEICHTCDVGNCIFPDHLFLGTYLDNINDMRRKGRGVDPPIISGESHPLATLSDEDVAEVRRLAGRQKQRDIAARFGVSQSTVWRLIHRQVRP